MLETIGGGGRGGAVAFVVQKDVGLGTGGNGGGGGGGVTAGSSGATSVSARVHKQQIPLNQLTAVLTLLTMSMVYEESHSK